ncbi:MAG: hypothetical protein SVY41_00310 [Candidatus Nanohaloarchaea archaeon]|nr:hypothetical protein [Candidatus Nanohaloarchaea archaeon]
MVRRGQYTIIEQVVLFTLGISITLGFLFAFNSLTEQVETDMKDVQSDLVAEYVASSGIELVESGAEGRVQVPVPEEIASEQYAVRMGDGGVQVQVAGDQAVASMYGLGSTLSVSGVAESGPGAVTITFQNGELELRGAE